MQIMDRKLIARGSNAFIAVSREDRRRMIELEKISPETAVFVPNGIPPLRPPSGHDVRAELGIGAADPIVTTVGFLRQPKAMDVLIEGAARIAPRFPRLKVLIVGEGADRGGLLVARPPPRRVGRGGGRRLAARRARPFLPRRTGR